MADLKVRGFNCRNCGAPVTVRGLTWTRTIVCPSCGAIQDPHDPNVLVLQDAASRMRITPGIPLGTRGRLAGDLYEVLGFQYRTITVDGDDYGWSEYLLFNPYAGFRYLSEYEGHWNVIRPLHAIPSGGDGPKAPAEFGGRRFRHFQTATATTAFVLGEFPWQVRAGDRVRTSDYVVDGLMLSAERTAEEVTWSLGEYTPGRDIWKAFELEGRPPAPKGVFANQPNPYDRAVNKLWSGFFRLLLILLVVFAFRMITADRERVFTSMYTFLPGSAEPSFVTPPFTLANGPSNVEIDIDTDLKNNWLYYELTLIDAETGTAYDVGEEVSYYFGRDSDGNWTEGSPRGSVRLPSVPAGRYFLRVEPEGDPKTATASVYSITVRRDVVALWPYGVALLLIAVPPVFVGWRYARFESARWAESGDGD